MESAEATATAEAGEAPENVNAGEQRPATQGERAFPHLWRDINGPGNRAVPRHLQQSLRLFIREQDVAWMLCELPFLWTHTVRLVECGEARRVNAYSLSYHSGYFRGVFTYTQSNSIDIHLGWLSPISPGILAAIDTLDLTGCHTEVTDDNCLQLYLAADFLLCQQLRLRCLAFVSRHLAEDPRLALDIWRAIHPFHLPRLAKLALRPLLRGFQALRLTGDFLDLEAAPLAEILNHGMLNCATELQVLDTVLQWSQRQPQLPARTAESHRRSRSRSRSRSPQSPLERLLRCVRIGLLTPEQLLAAVAALDKQQPVAPGTGEFGKLRHRLLHHASSESDGASLSSQLPRLPHQVVLLLLSQLPGGPIAACRVYNPRADAWCTGWTPDGRRLVSDVRDPRLPLPPPAGEIGGQASRVSRVIAVGQWIYLVGGWWLGAAHRAVLRYDRRRPRQGWTVASYMTVARCDHCCATVGGFLYALGGASSPHEQTRLASVERMSLPVRATRPAPGEEAAEAGDDDDDSGCLWSPVDPMLRPRSDAAAAGYRGGLLVVGGFDGRQHLDSAEIYCPTDGAWTLLPGCMSQRRSGLGLAVVGDAAYALCGRNASGWRRSIERWEEGRGFGGGGSWRANWKIGTHRSNFGCAAIDSRIYLFGGVNAAGPVTSTEWLDPTQQPAVYGTGAPVAQPSESLAACLLDMEFDLD